MRLARRTIRRLSELQKTPPVVTAPDAHASSILLPSQPEANPSVITVVGTSGQAIAYLLPSVPWTVATASTYLSRRGFEILPGFSPNGPSEDLLLGDAQVLKPGGVYYLQHPPKWQYAFYIAVASALGILVLNSLIKSIIVSALEDDDDFDTALEPPTPLPSSARSVLFDEHGRLSRRLAPAWCSVRAPTPPTAPPAPRKRTPTPTSVIDESAMENLDEALLSGAEAGAPLKPTSRHRRQQIELIGPPTLFHGAVAVPKSQRVERAT